jgi:hypothetical protein
VLRFLDVLNVKAFVSQHGLLRVLGSGACHNFPFQWMIVRVRRRIKIM